MRINRSQQAWAVLDLKLETQEAELWLYIARGVREPRALIYEPPGESLG